MAARHFPYQHPTFGTSKNPKTASHWKVSVYYWWYEYLKRNADYRETCRHKGTGTCAEIYAHFGDVTQQDFKTWWTENDRGAVLFAEPPTPSLRVVPEETLAQGGFTPENALIIEVPLDLPLTLLVRDFRKVLASHHERSRGQGRLAKSKARFVATGKIDTKFFEIALMVWDQRQAEPKKPWWKIAQDLTLAPAHKILASDSPSVVTAKKNVLTSTASRYYQKATRMIERTGVGRFPN